MDEPVGRAPASTTGAGEPLAVNIDGSAAHPMTARNGHCGAPAFATTVASDGCF